MYVEIANCNVICEHVLFNVNAQCFYIRDRSRLFDQVGHQTTNASIGNKYFSTKECHPQTYQNYEQSRELTKIRHIFSK